LSKFIDPFLLTGPFKVKEGGKANELSLGERITFSRGEETCWIAGAMGQQDLYKAKLNYL
jgi:hypothetical protein